MPEAIATGWTLSGTNIISDAGASVGIGDANSPADLDVSGNLQLSASGITFFDNTRQITAGVVASGDKTENNLIKWTADGSATSSSIIEDANGNVGILTGNPTEALDVGGTIRATSLKTSSISAGIVKADALEIASTATISGTLTAVAGSDTWSGDFLGVPTSNKVRLGTYGSTAAIGANNNAGTAWANLAINPGGGNVGIGTSTPTEKLEVVGGDIKIIGDANHKDAILKLRGAWTGTNGANEWHIIQGSSNADLGGVLRIRDASNPSIPDVITFKTDGNVGIGITPTEKLEVAGNIKASGDVNGGRLCISGVCQASWSIGGASFTSNYADSGVLVKGTNGFDGSNEAATVFLGDFGNYIRSVWGEGIKIGAYQAPDAIVLQQTTGNVGIGLVPGVKPSAKLDVAGSIKSYGLDVGKVKVKSTGIIINNNYDTQTACNTDAEGMLWYSRDAASQGQLSYCAYRNGGFTWILL